MEVVATTLNRHVKGLPKVELFLDSKERRSKSKQTRNSYLTTLIHFSEFISIKYPKYDIETILKALISDEIDRYELLEAFVSFEDKRGVLSVKSRIQHLAIVKSYLAYHRVYLIPEMFKNSVTPPRLYREDGEALSIEDVRKLFLACNNRRLKPYMMLLESSGVRAVEGLSIILKDVDFSTSPVKIHIRRKYSKTRIDRDSFISDEAAQCLKNWLDFKYRDRGKYKPRRERNKEDLVFAVKSGVTNPYLLYTEVRKDFNKVLEVAGLNARKEGMKRRLITLHSFRRFTKSIVSDQAGKDYSEWLIGHAKSPYYTKKMPEKMEIYKQLCMPSLTILDYSELKIHSKNIDVNLAQKDAEIQRLTQQVAKLQEQQATIIDQTQKESFESMKASIDKKVYESMKTFTDQKQKELDEKFDKLMEMGKQFENRAIAAETKLKGKAKGDK